MRIDRFLRSCILAAIACGAMAAAARPRTPIVLDTDIGGDIDDAFALAMVLECPELDLKAVTTVSGNAQARARIAARMLTEAGQGGIPVAAGASDRSAETAQEQWAESFHSSALAGLDAVSLMKQTIDSHPGRIVLVAIGPLTNLADLLRRHPDVKPKIRRIVLMGGSIAHGYTQGSGQIAESNILSDVDAAQTVFSSGIPLAVAPLDVTARLQLEAGDRAEIFTRHTGLTDALESLYKAWGQPTPTLHDPMALALLTKPRLCKRKPVRIEIGRDGYTRIVAHGPPNATVAFATNPAGFLAYFTSLFTR